jgi:hypothetical protein
MSSCRALVFFASMFLGVASASAQLQGTVAPGQVQGTSVAPPLFQGIMVDAKGKTVGRINIGMFENGPNIVIRLIEGIWVALMVADPTSGFITGQAAGFTTYYQSADCTGQALLYVNPNHGTAFPALGQVVTIPPATAPSIYFAGTPSFLNLNSGRQGDQCFPFGNQSGYLGPLQFVPLSSLGLTLPFKVK